MQVYKLQFPHELNKDHLPPISLALGYFDGIHLGHQEVINTAVNTAKKKKLQSAVMTFNPHPSVVLKKEEQHVKFITPLEDKLKLFEQLNVDIVFVVTFNEKLANLTPEQFVNHFIIQLNVKHVVAGFDFSYGKMGKGSMDSMPLHANGLFDTTTVNKVTEGKEKISSSLIRYELSRGNMQHVQKLLGRPYQIVGTVVQGDKRGRTIGYPTANIQLVEDYILPKVGVYAVGLEINNIKYNGMANIGYKPTFQGEELKLTVEVYIFNFDRDIYGEEIKLHLYHYIREEKKFSGIDALKLQLEEDETEIRQFFKNS